MQAVFENDVSGSKALLSYIYHRIEDLINSYLQCHSKVFVVRADVRYPVYYPPVYNNLHIQRCIAKTAQFLKRHNYDPAYIWVREQKTSEHPHYHCIFLFNGHKTQSGGLVFALLTRYWGNTLGTDAEGLIHYCNYTIEGAVCRYGYMVHRGIGIPAQVYGMMTYLAKEDGKGEPKDGLRDFGMSRIRKVRPKMKNDRE